MKKKIILEIIFSSIALIVNYYFDSPKYIIAWIIIWICLHTINHIIEKELLERAKFLNDFIGGKI